MATYRAVIVYDVEDNEYELWSDPSSLAKALENYSGDSDAQIRVRTADSSVERIAHPDAPDDAPGHRIVEMWAWVGLDDGDGNEGIPAFLAEDGVTQMPMVGSRRKAIESLRPIALQAAAISRHPFQLRRFAVMTVEETLPAGRS